MYLLICKMPHLQKDRKFKKNQSANLQICALRNMDADRPTLSVEKLFLREICKSNYYYILQAYFLENSTL